MEPGQTIAYISDIGATNLQPLFIAGSAVSVVVFDVCFISERWLRHKGRLAHNTSLTQKVLSGFACAFAIIGAIGLILLTILDTVDHPTAHDICLVIFMYVYIITSLRSSLTISTVSDTSSQPSSLALNTNVWVFTSANTVSCAPRSGSSWPSSSSRLVLQLVRLLPASSLEFTANTFSAFASLGRTASKRNIAAILEWVISLIYIIYQAHYAMDFFPAVHSKDNRFPSVAEMIEQGGNGPSYSGGPTFSESASYASENPIRANGQTVEPSRNF
jgi:hypothetical protein